MQGLVVFVEKKSSMEFPFYWRPPWSWRRCHWGVWWSRELVLAWARLHAEQARNRFWEPLWCQTDYILILLRSYNRIRYGGWTKFTHLLHHCTRLISSSYKRNWIYIYIYIYIVSLSFYHMFQSTKKKPQKLIPNSYLHDPSLTGLTSGFLRMSPYHILPGLPRSSSGPRFAGTPAQARSYLS